MTWCWWSRGLVANALPHATEDLYDAGGNQLTPTVWENHSEVDGVQVYQTSDSLGQEMLAIDNADGEKHKSSILKEQLSL